MGFGTWGLFVLVVVPLLQVPGMYLLLRYVRRDEESDPSQPVGDEFVPIDPTERATPNTLTCVRCGTENDLGYVYCRNCVARLR